jgi:hypothetical protein
MIATPTAGGSVKALYAVTLVKVVMAIKAAGWETNFTILDGCYVSRARNYFANLLLRQPRITHLAMIDSDMSFEGDLICRLLRFNKPIIAAAYSQRRIDLARFAQSARHSELGLDDLAALTLDYNLRPELESGTHHVRVVDGICPVSQIALGCALIRRDAFESLVEGKVVDLRPDGVLENLGLDGPFYDFFGELTLEDGQVLSEDYSFCRRWRSVPNNEIWAMVDQPIGHVGDMIYGAPYIKRLLQGKA